LVELALPISTTLPIPSSTKLASSQAATPKRNSTPVPPPSSAKAETFESLQLLISLDTALSLIHADRDALKRVETFQAYPGRTGARVKETIEEVFIMLLQAMSDRHIGPGFRIATEQMRKYKPAEHEEARSVAPLLQFFELVHVGDTIQSMVQVYFDKEMVRPRHFPLKSSLPSFSKS
jgi:recyclin-1